MCDHYARFLILTYAAARGIHRDKIPIAARAKHRTSDRQHLRNTREPSYTSVYRKSASLNSRLFTDEDLFKLTLSRVSSVKLRNKI